MDYIIQALGFFADPLNIAMLLVGGFIGTLFSAIPGLTGTLALAIILPFTYALEREPAFILMVGMIGGTIYGGCLTAITINIPGAPSSVCSTLDGYPMFKQGKGAEAIGLATFSSFVGGTISAIILFIAAPQLAKFAIRFGAPEYVMLCVFGMVAVITLSKNLLKAFVSALLGLLMSTIGADLFGSLRFTYGTRFLMSGVSVVPVVVGLFALSMVLEEANEYFHKEEHSKIFLDAAKNYKRMKMPSKQTIVKHIPMFLRESFIGTFVGFLPGSGGNVASFIAYNLERKLSKTPEKYGTGFEDGIIAPETANNATLGGILIPTLVLGIPGDQFTAVMLGAFLIHGLPVGPLLFTENPVFIYVVFWTALFCNVIMVLYGYLGGKYFVKMAALRKSILIPTIAIIALTGSFASSNMIYSVGVAIIFAIVGTLFKRYDYPFAPIVLGLTLGSTIENSMLQSLMMSRNGFMIFLTRPVSVFFIVCSALFIITQFVKPSKLFGKRNKDETSQESQQ